MATKTKKKTTVRRKTTNSRPVAQVCLRLISKHQALPTTVVRDYAQRATRKRYTQEAISDALRKLYQRGKISRLTRGVYCAKGLI